MVWAVREQNWSRKKRRCSNLFLKQSLCSPSKILPLVLPACSHTLVKGMTKMEAATQREPRLSRKTTYRKLVVFLHSLLATANWEGKLYLQRVGLVNGKLKKSICGSDQKFYQKSKISGKKRQRLIKQLTLHMVLKAFTTCKWKKFQPLSI